MKKLVFLVMAIGLIVMMGATSFAIDAPAAPYKPYSGNGIYGHVTKDNPLKATLEGNFAYVNPFAMVEFGTIQKAILEGDGGLKGDVEGSLWAIGSVPVTLYTNCAVRMSATIKEGRFNWEFNNKIGQDPKSNHPFPAGNNNQPYRALPVDLKWDGDASWTMGKNIYEDGKPDVDTTAQSSKLFDCWTYSENLLFKVHVPVDLPQYDPKSIDELHAGNYKGTLVVTISPAESGSKEPVYDVQHNGRYSCRYPSAQ